jgi:hypothetical protein
MMIHLLDGTYELFRHYYGRRRFEKEKLAPFGAVTGVLHTGAGNDREGGDAPRRATDHVIESSGFRGERDGIEIAYGPEPTTGARQWRL